MIAGDATAHLGTPRNMAPEQMHRNCEAAAAKSVAVGMLVRSLAQEASVFTPALVRPCPAPLRLQTTHLWTSLLLAACFTSCFWVLTHGITM